MINQYLLFIEVQIWQNKMLVSIDAILNFRLTKSHKDFSVSSLDSIRYAALLVGNPNLVMVASTLHVGIGPSNKIK